MLKSNGHDPEFCMVSKDNARDSSKHGRISEFRGIIHKDMQADRQPNQTDRQINSYAKSQSEGQL